MFNIVGKRFMFFLISGSLMIISIISLARFGLKAGVDFSSGTMMTVSFEQKVDESGLKKEMADLGYASATIQGIGEDGFLVRLPELNDAAQVELKASLTAKFGALKVANFDIVSPLVAKETTRNTLMAIAACSVAILLYLSWAFRRMPNPFHFGTCAVIALIHDILLVAGVFSIFGRILGWEINLMFITGILAILGYTVNNTIIIFDRIRENLLSGRSTDFEVIVNNSVVETLGRSMNTNLTTIFPIVTLMLFVGASIQNLLVVLLVGIIVGTYDSICVAPSLLVVWKKGEWGRFIPWRRQPAAKA